MLITLQNNLVTWITVIASLQSTSSKKFNNFDQIHWTNNCACCWIHIFLGRNPILQGEISLVNKVESREREKLFSWYWESRANLLDGLNIENHLQECGCFLDTSTWNRWQAVMKCTWGVLSWVYTWKYTIQILLVAPRIVNKARRWQTVHVLLVYWLLFIGLVVYNLPELGSFTPYCSGCIHY